MARVEIGDRRNRVTIERKVRGASDGAGGNVAETWGTYVRLWAHVDMRNAREIVAADQTVHRLSAVVTILYRTDLTTAMRLVYKGGTYAILGIRHLADGGWSRTELQCEEGAPS